MKVALLGANGQLGSDIHRELSECGARFTVLPLHRRDLDVSRTEDIAPFLNDLDFDVLVNCTSYHKTDEVEENADLAFRVNAHAVHEMAKVCREKTRWLIHFSTDYVFSGSGTRPYTEADGIGPLNVYGASKAMGEGLALLEYDQVAVLRVASLFGVVGASGKGGNFIEAILKRAKETGSIKVVDDIRMSPTSTATVARIVRHVLENLDSLKGGIYHVVNSGEASWFEFAREAVTQAGVKAEVVPIPSSEYPTAARRPAYSVLDNGKITSVVGGIPHWTDALDEYLRAKGHKGV